MSEKMTDTMTLEQVRDWHLEEAKRLNKSQHPFPDNSTVLDALIKHHQAMADAIDAAIAPQRGLLCGTTPDGRPYALRGTPESVHAVSDLIEQATAQDARDEQADFSFTTNEVAECFDCLADRGPRLVPAEVIEQMRACCLAVAIRLGETKWLI